MNKIAVVILSDPKSGSEEALGRLFNGLVTAYDAKQRGDDITVLFQGTGVRWTGIITQPEHPAYKLYQAVADNIAGASCGCADVFGARQTVEDNGFKLIEESLIPGASGVPSLAGRLAAGYSIITF